MQKLIKFKIKIKNEYIKNNAKFFPENKKTKNIKQNLY